MTHPLSAWNTQPWSHDALCAQTDPEAHFPRVGHGTDDAAAAKRTCRACTVRAECLEWATRHHERHGIWGGYSERERRRLENHPDQLDAVLAQIRATQPPTTAPISPRQRWTA